MEGFDDAISIFCNPRNFSHLWSAAANWVQLLFLLQTHPCQWRVGGLGGAVFFWIFDFVQFAFKSVSYLIQFPTGGRPPLWVTVLWEWSKHVAGEFMGSWTRTLLQEYLPHCRSAPQIIFKRFSRQWPKVLVTSLSSSEQGKLFIGEGGDVGVN